MKKYLFLIALWIAFLAPGTANATAKFLVLCTTACTWDNTNDTIWSLSSGGINNTTHPVAADDVTLDASSCVGGVTCTITTGAVTISINSLNMSAFTASTSGGILEANTNSTNFTVASASPYINTGAGNRTLSGGNWTLSNNSAAWNINASATVTNAPSISFNGTGGTGSRRFIGGGKSYGTVSVSSGTSALIITGNNTIATFSPSAGNTISFPAGGTTTITTLTNITGNSSAQTLFLADNATNGRATISSANNWTCTWCGFYGMTFSGGGTFAATTSFDFTGNSGFTPSIVPPVIGTGGGRIIGG